MNSFQSRSAPYALFLLSLASVQLVCAQSAPGGGTEPSYFELRTGATRSDNLTRIADEEIDGTMYSVGLGMDKRYRGSRVDLRGYADLDWIKYPSDTFDDELTGYFDGHADYQFIPGRFEWKTRETYGQLTTDPFAPATPDNREGVSYFTTGPVLMLPLGSATQLKLDADYFRTDQEKPNVDSNRYGLGAALLRKVSQTGTLSLNTNIRRTQYQDGFHTRYDEREAFVSYDAQGKRTSTLLLLGYAELDRGDESSSGLMARIDLRHRISASNNVSVFAGRQLSDSGDLFRGSLDQRGSSTPVIGLSVSDRFEDRSVGLGWGFDKRRTRLGFSGSRHEQLYERNIGSNRIVNRYDAYFERRLRPHLTLGLEGYRQRERFDISQFHYQETGYGATLGWTFSRLFGVALRYNLIDRTASDSDVEFTEHRAGIRFFYRPDRR